ncbi:MAG: guanylate kinase [Lysobacterales bacterium]|jgi:guanylate kinase
MSNSGRKGLLFIVAAPSGAGKTSLVNELLRRDPCLVLSVSHTTRPARPGEREGQQYHFVSPADFRRMVRAGEFLEHARVFDHDYGTSRRAVERDLEAGRDVILEIDWQGARQVREVIPGCCSIFILPPTLEALEERLAGRGQDSGAVIQRRMRAARAEISHWAEFDQLVVNDDFERAVTELLGIVEDRRAGRCRPPGENDQNLAQQLGKS